MLSNSRYDRNAKLYEQVKNNDYDSYNAQVKDVELEFSSSQPRKEYQEKKRLNKYFDDLDTSISDVNVKLDSLKKQDTLEMKDEVDLKSLIETAKKKQMESGGKIFTNTQHEILNSLNVGEEEPVDLENIVGAVAAADLLVDANSSEFDNTVVLEEGYENVVIAGDGQTSEIDFDDLETAANNEDIVESSVFMGSDQSEAIDEEVTEFSDLEEEYEEVEDFTSEMEFDDFDEEEEEEYYEDEKPVKSKGGLNSAIVTVILILLIILLIVLGVVVASQYLEVF